MPSVLRHFKLNAYIPFSEFNYPTITHFNFMMILHFLRNANRPLVAHMTHASLFFRVSSSPARAEQLLNASTAHVDVDATRYPPPCPGPARMLA